MKFTEYIADKYGGKVVLGPFNNEIIVKSIADMRFEHLDIDDQRLALSPSVGWAWGFGNVESLEESTEFKGYLFRPKQRIWWFAPEAYPAYIGAFASAKTLILVLKCLDNCLRWPGTKGLIMRQTYKQLLDSTIATLIGKIFPYLGWGDAQFEHKVGAHEVHIYVAGKTSKLIYRPSKNEQGSIDEVIQDIQSTEYDFIGLDEVPGIDYKLFQPLTGRLGRWGSITDSSRHQLMAVGNPPNDGTWVHDHWFNHTFHDREKTPLSDPENYSLVRASTEDNRANLHPAYIEKLKAMHPTLRRIFYEGKIGYIPPDGIPVYDTFNPDLYVENKGIAIPKGVTIYRGWDCGPTDKYKCMVCGFIDFKNVFNVVHEFLYDGPGLDTFAQLCIRECNRRFPDSKRFLDFGDPIILNVIAETDRKSAAMILRKYGIILRAGETSFNIRKNAVDQVMNRILDGTPGMRIDARYCPNIIRGFRGSYRYKDIDADEGVISTNPIKNLFAHYMNALEYLCSRLESVATKDRKKLREKIKARNPEVYKNRRFRPEVVTRLRRA